MRTLIIIPAYNEAQNIERVVDNLVNNYPQYDYVVINDGSKDATAEICRSNNYNLIDLPVNLGIGGGVQTGYLYAFQNKYDIAIQMDGDGQHDPSELSKIITPIQEGKADFVIGSRFITNEGFQTSVIRRLGINFISAVIKLCVQVRVLDTTSGFRAVNKKCIALFAKNYAVDYPEPEAIVFAALNGAKIREVPVIMHERTAGTSSINTIRAMYYMVKVSVALILLALFNKGKK